MIGRRAVLRLIGAAPIAGKVVADEAAKSLGGIGMYSTSPQSSVGSVLNSNGSTSMGWIGGGGGGPSQCNEAVDFLNLRKLRETAIRAALDTKESRREIESIFYEDARRIGVIDPDIGAMKSWSLNAKVTFQRQRNVRQSIECGIAEQSPWERAQGWRSRVLGLIGLKG